MIELTEYRDILEKMRYKMFEYMRESKDGLIDDFFRKVMKENHLA